MVWKISKNPEEKWDVSWNDGSISPDQFAKMQIFQKINHFPGNF